ncbi:MAG: dihydroneopterin aldolase [Candidatus Omnitrophica bacterium]|nr:dihydroneopterin aldolase [Candidatus Omnitrophota bacterium]
MAKIRITNLRLRTVIGANDWERDIEQDVIINIEMDFDASPSIQSDDLTDTIDYKTITKEIIEKVEASEFFLIEKLADMVLRIVMKDKRVKAATVRLDKPHALRFADSVSIELTEQR